MNDIRIISLFDMIGPVCGTAEDGKRVNAAIQATLNEGLSVKLNFEGVKLVTASFHNAALDDLVSVSPGQSLSTELFDGNQNIGSISFFVAECAR